MKTYTVLYAEDVPHYGFHDIEAENDQAAIEAAITLHKRGEVSLPEAHWDSTVCARIVHIEDPDGNIIVDDKPLDDYFIRGGGQADRLLCDTAEDMLAVLEYAIETEQGNWDGQDEEPNWLRQARAVTAKARGLA